MPRHLTWLLAGAALTLTATAATAAAVEAAAEAAKDSAAAAPRADKTQKIERREVRVYRSGDSDGAPQVQVFRDDDGGNRRVEIYRHDGPGDHGDHDMAFMSRGAGRGDHLKALLQLRTEQDGALKAYLEATGPQPRSERPPRMERSVDTKRTALDKLADAEKRLDEQQAGSRKRIAATRAFYNQLDDRQKRAFDEMPMVLVVGPDIGPMLMPGPGMVSMHMQHMDGMPPPPLPPLPPTPPRPPRS